MENTSEHPKMEKLQVKVQTQSQSQEASNKKQLVWDCGSSLYDSFELNSFKRQLDSAIVSRTLSMPRLPDSRAPLPAVAKKSSSKISRSLQKLLKSVFKSKHSSSTSWLKLRDSSNDEYCVYYDKTGALTTIPEVPEIDFWWAVAGDQFFGKKNGVGEIYCSTIAISCA